MRLFNDHSAHDIWQADIGDAAGFSRHVKGFALQDGQAVTSAAPPSPTRAQEVSYLNGVNANGTLTSTSYWGDNGQTAFKWGSATLGTGATITYFFDTKSHFTANEKATFLKAFAMWSSVANVTFVEGSSKGSSNVLLHRGNDGGAYTSTPATNGSGSTPGSVSGQALISIDSSVDGFELDGSFSKYGGYGLSAVIHEVGHLLGLGHGGDYNGDVNAKRDQFSAYDDRMYSIMSYIYWGNDDAKFLSQNPNQGTNWGITDDSIQRQSPHTIQQLDILAIQQLYGVSATTPFSGGQTYGFHSNIAGPLHDFFDFTVNTDPVVTLYNQGTGNTLDLSGYSNDQRIDLRPGQFSDVGGHTNNLAIADNTLIGTAIGGGGNDSLRANDDHGTLIGGAGNDKLFGGLGNDILQGDSGQDQLSGYAGRDVLTGGDGADTFFYYKIQESGKNLRLSDTITDFDHAAGDKIDLSAIDADKSVARNQAFTFIGTDAFSHHGGELRYYVAGGDVIVQGDVNGDGKADFNIRLEDVSTVFVSDFVL